MKITDILSKQAIKIGLDASNKEEALKELVDVLTTVKDVGDKKAIVKALIERENLGSTGIGQGIAIPHGKTDRVNELIAVLGISKKGVNFEALDGEPVFIFFLLVAPRDSAGPHLKALAKISRLLRDNYICELLRNSKDEKEAYDIIRNEEEKRH
ncbi:MAG TPA: PTS sugar transporter subunit IIA [Candidatus Omnitrophota bacterium]|nr:PTS sugar transporter subunit IIA [Candidatus Omnitrophota bacterium]